MSRPPGAWAFHVARAAQERFGLDDVPAAAGDDEIGTDMAAIRRLAMRMNAARPVGWAPVLPGQIAALAVLHQVGHLVIERRAAARLADGESLLGGALGALRAAIGAAVDGLLDTVAGSFPADARSAGPERKEDLLAELLLIQVASENPAAEPLRELFDSPLGGLPAYPRALAVLEQVLGMGAPETDPDQHPDSGPLLAILRAPANHAPASLVGQLRFVRDHWLPSLGDAAGGIRRQLDGALGELAEEESALHRGFAGGGPGHGVGMSQAPDLASLDSDPERFSVDSDWMPGLVLQARSTYVWLDQLSRRYGRPIATLDAIPDEELDSLEAWGVTGLWLIGVWERSKASAAIKQRRGNPHAMASAYALDDYRIAAELGGEDALVRLRDRALVHGIRLACDMVPNHMGIDSRWLIDHPEWFLSVPESPYPAYTFNGPNLARDERVEIVLDDHYWDGSDAAVVFLHRDRASGESRFVYHGNDGTSLPWNDTAQLDFIRADVREQVIRTIVDVARQFPIIRFDAAMVLARRHVQRLWWPEPGAGGGVPSRAAHAIAMAEFDRRMPAEFWREVVDRVAAEAPGTLLLAEAFWLMEGYFVRTLGMHRVYNSAFMHMLRDDDIAGYRRVIQETLELDPAILERYVNFMTNPDEATALEQFGRDDKCFGVATVLATLPGLPMLGHGQVEGFAEKYGMEFRRAMLDEAPDPVLIARHEREIAPLLRERQRYARAMDFRLYDLVRDDGTVDDSVLAYSNGRGDGRSLVLYHGRFAEASGRLHDSAAFAARNDTGSTTVRRDALADALELPDDPDAVLGFRDRRSGLEHLARVAAVRGAGLPVRLGAYDYRVFEGFRILDGGLARWGWLTDRLDGGGVASLDEALLDVDLAPLHDRLRALFSDGHVGRLVEAIVPSPAAASSGRPALTVDLPSGAGHPLDDNGGFAGALAAVADWERELRAAGTNLGVQDLSSPTDPRTARDRLAGAPEAARRISRVTGLLAAAPTRTALTLALLLGGGSLDPRAGGAARARFDACRLAGPLADALRRLGLGDTASKASVARVRALLALPGADSSGAGATAPGRRAADWLADPAVRSAAGVHRWEGAEWLVREAWDALVDAAAALQALNARHPADIAAAGQLAHDLRIEAEAAGYSADRLGAT